MVFNVSYKKVASIPLDYNLFDGILKVRSLKTSLWFEKGKPRVIWGRKIVRPAIFGIGRLPNRIR